MDGSLGTLVQALERADDSPYSRALLAFAATASEAAHRAAWVLSVSVGATRSDVTAVIRAVWPETDAEDAIHAVAAWPFTEASGDTWKLADAFVSEVALDFQSSEPESFWRTHQVLAERERVRQAEASHELSWFSAARLAFYLAGVAPSEAESRFETSFRDPPEWDRATARMWLSGLALRQERLLGRNSRTVRFFRGFRFYTAGLRPTAQLEFAEVIAGPERDAFRAVALHLSGQIYATQNDGKAIGLLQDSVRLSEQMDFQTNAILARNTLVWAYISAARRTPDSDRVGEMLRAAADLAEENASIAEVYGEAGFIDVTAVSRLEAKYLAETKLEAHPERVGKDEVAQLVGDARGVWESMLLGGRDPGTGLLALNLAARALRDHGDLEDALATIREGIDAYRPTESDQHALGRLAQTVGSMRGLVRGGMLEPQVASLLGRLDELQEG